MRGIGETHYPGITQMSLGIESLEVSHKEWLRTTRDYARKHSLGWGRVSSDILRFAEEFGNLGSPHHPNAWGGVFKEKRDDGYWKCIGTKHSTVESNHSRRICIWKWIPKDQG